MGDNLWIDILTELVRSHWSTTERALLLSKVKFELEQKGVDVVKALNGRKLKESILEDGKDHLRLVKNPDQPLVWGVLPTEATLPGEMARVFGANEPKAPDAAPSPRFHRAIWLAFAKPIRDGHRRYIEIGPPSKFVDIPQGGTPPATGAEVDRAFIYNPSGQLVPEEDHQREVEKNIRDWSQTKHIPLERLIIDKESTIGRTSLSNKDRRQLDLIDFSALSQSEKARILIPLDILIKLKFGRN